MNRIITKYILDDIPVYIIIFFLILFNPLIAQKNIHNAYFEVLSVKDGLTHNAVHDIIQDRTGFIWIATEVGLNRYDGINFKDYSYNKYKLNNLSDNFVSTLTQDDDGNLWIGTNSGGLYKYDTHYDNFINFSFNELDSNSISDNNISKVYKDFEGNIWIGTQEGEINLLKKNSHKFISFTKHRINRNSLSTNYIISFLRDRTGILWIGTGDGLKRLDLTTNQFKIYKHNVNDNSTISNNSITSLFEDAEGRIWIGTDEGLNLYDSIKDRFYRFSDKLSKNFSLKNNGILSIAGDEEQNILIGTNLGYVLKISDIDNLIRKKYVGIEIHKISEFPISSIFTDNSGIVWYGSIGGGILKYDRKKSVFHTFNFFGDKDNNPSGNAIRSICEDKNGLLWIGTIGKGLYVLDRKTFLLKNVLFDTGTKDIYQNFITKIYEDKKGTIWIGTWNGGLKKIQGKNTLTKRGPTLIVNNFNTSEYRYKTDGLFDISGNIIQDIYEDKDGDMWIGTDHGLSIYNAIRDNFFSIEYNGSTTNGISDGRVQSNCIKEDKVGNVWVGTWNGLNLLTNSEVKKIKLMLRSGEYDSKKINFRKFFHNIADSNSLSDSKIISMLFDANSELWIGTHGGGLNKLLIDSSSNNTIKYSFIHFRKNDGLCSDVIYGMLNDEMNNLWLSTNDGLSKFNPITTKFANYFESDGLQSNHFFWGAYFKNKNGELFFGGTKGITSFYPADLIPNLYKPPIVFTDFKIFDRSLSVHEKNSPIKSTITYVDEIELKHDMNIFAISFAALDYSNPDKNQYKYLLEGFDPEWRSTENQRYATYTNLDPGEYTFKVIGSNNDSFWNYEGTSIKIKVLPPFWKTWWFISIFFLFSIMTVVFLIYYRVKQLLAIERLRTKLAADLHDNIGSSLTEISIMSEVILTTVKDTSELVYKNLKVISEESRNLVDKMSDIVWLVNPQKDSLYDLIIRLYDTYSELLSYKDISFRSENLESLKNISLSIEHRQNLYLILKEAVNNSVTHSNCNEILLYTKVAKKEITVILKDDGIGFALNEIHSGSGITNMKKRAKKIGGKIDIHREDNKYTVVEFIGKLK